LLSVSRHSLWKRGVSRKRCLRDSPVFKGNGSLNKTTSLFYWQQKKTKNSKSCSPLRKKMNAVNFLFSEKISYFSRNFFFRTKSRFSTKTASFSRKQSFREKDKKEYYYESKVDVIQWVKCQSSKLKVANSTCEYYRHIL